MATKNKSNEITTTRLYSAPVKTVWEAWTDPKQTALWWGPRDFSLTTQSKDLKPGGTWKHTMHGPDGVDYPCTTQYLEVEKYAKLVYDHGGSDNQPPMFRVHVLFSESKGKTQMEMTVTLPTPEAAEETRKFIKKANGDATWDRLTEYLEKGQSGKETFVINRSFAAPLNAMFEMWTNPKHFSQWLAPAGFDMQFVRCEIKAGGSSFYFMTGPDQIKWYGRAEYLKVEKPDLVVYAQQFCDEKEKVRRHPMSPHWPETMLTTVQLTQEGSEQTRVTVTWEPHGTTTRQELETFIKAKGGMTIGWTGSFDKLETYLEKQ